MIAVLYDIHGNLPALEAVLEDARAAGAGRFVLGGDYALFGPWPRETVERLRELDAHWIRGNGERWTADSSSAPDDEVVQGAIAAARDTLGEALVHELGDLPESYVDGSTRYVHGSPVSDVRSFLPEPAADDAELMGDARERRLVFGHTHLPFEREGPDEIDLLNPGSVGMPFDGDTRAAYALIGDDGTVERRRVDYDHAGAAAALRERFDGGFAEVVARRIERASFDA